MHKIAFQLNEALSMIILLPFVAHFKLVDLRMLLLSIGYIGSADDYMLANQLKAILYIPLPK